jgi:small GTP-binding protein
MDDLKEIKKKVILLGDGAVGKTSLIRKFVINKFDDNYLHTIGFKITAKDIQVTTNGQTHFIKLQIWDILGQKGYIELHKSSLPGTAGVFLVADITRKETLKSLETYWIPQFKSIVGSVPFVILANKYDLTDEAEFGVEELTKVATKYGVPYFLTSAKNGANVKKAFITLGKRMLEPNGSEVPKPNEFKVSQEEVNTIASVIDKIIVDFCNEYGRHDDAMPVLRKQFEIAQLNLNEPKIEAIVMAIKRLAIIEKGFKDNEAVRVNLRKRLKWVKEAELT